jgi:hypothetical protein
VALPGEVTIIEVEELPEKAPIEVPTEAPAEPVEV